MGAMKAMKAMKAIKKKSVSKVAKGKFRKVLVLRGTKAKTVGGLTANDLMKNTHGRVVSKKQSAANKKKTQGWLQALSKARAALKIKGFVAVKKGTPLYQKAKEIYGH